MGHHAMNRRQLLSGLIAVTAPAIVPFKSLMPLRGYVMTESMPYGIQKGAVYYVKSISNENQFSIDVTNSTVININDCGSFRPGDRILFS